MDIKISNQVQEPIYQQIATELRTKILSSTLRANEQLPSIRALAKELEVGIITVKKAYEVLMTENLIFSKGAVGYFVGEIDIKEILLLKKEDFLKEVEQVIDKALSEGLTLEDVKEVIHKVWEEKDHGNQSK